LGKSIRHFIGWGKLMVGKMQWENCIREKLSCKKLVSPFETPVESCSKSLSKNKIKKKRK